ncbi:MAG: SDR family NAD(P)-dependent oxidoreductase [Gammaproteobacteria bacterium]|nr:SDR family NAD(P)-dependent oxidoreductase [Gammaproteobacteria bacterium]
MKTKNSEKKTDIAIIGMACRFPGAKNYEEYWDNLITGKNCVSEIPAERWRWEHYYGDPTSENSKTNIKYGGFIEDVSKFDPLYFNISPREASYIDPQHRIFLESVWHAIEDAGYNPRSLAGKDIGVYAGVSKNDYAELMREYQVPIISFLSTGTVHSILANRVSYLLDFQGKSEVVDTACSSFLVALDNAVNDINVGFCESAVVGGVNAILSPTMYISHSKSGMLSEDGQCRSFDAKANGYVRGEGVGVVFIKSLRQALSDNDNILGVIKGSAVKHGGRSNFLTAPKVSAQAATISAAIKASDINPKTIGYIETHGTGTPLGDPIEINALKQAYQPYLNGGEASFCGLTSTKTNIGHLESAAGVAGLIKVLLSFKYKIIPSLLHFETLNPYIKLDGSPFYIVDKNQAWNKITLAGIEHPLRAGISSFGMGGVNAHVIVEEPPCLGREKPVVAPLSTDKKYMVPLSAKTNAQLHEYATSLYRYLSDREEYCTINDVCSTLQNGREALEKRVVFLADDYRHLLDILKAFIENKQSDQVFVGDAGKENTTHSASRVIDNHNSDEIVKHWLKGDDINWKCFRQNQVGNKIQLPAYPFQKRHCWFPRLEENEKPLSNEKKGTGSVYQDFLKSDYFIRDHRVKGVNIVPGVKCLGVFQEIGEKISQESVRKLEDIYWARAIKVENDIRIDVKYTTNNIGKSYNLSLEKEGEKYCTGKIVTDSQVKPLHRIDIGKIKARCGDTLGYQALYHQFENNGLDYGDTFQTIKTCNYNKTEILCVLKRAYSGNSSNSMLEPSMLDGVFQSVVALQILNAEKKQEQHVPFYLKSIKIHRNIPDQCYAYSAISRKPSEGGRTAFNMYLCDQRGNIIVEFSEFVKRVYSPLSSSNHVFEKNVSSNYISSNSDFSRKISINNDNHIMEKTMLHYTPRWILRKSGMHNENISCLIIFDTNPSLATLLRKTGSYQTVILVKMGDQFKQTGKNTYTVNHKKGHSFKSLWDSLKKRGIDVEAILYKWNYKDSSSISHNLDFGIKLLLLLTQSLMFAKLPKRVRIFYLYLIQDSVASCLHSSVGAFSRTLAFENPNIRLTSVGLSEHSPEKIANVARQELSFYQNSPLNEVQYINGQRKIRVIIRYKGFSGALDKSLIKHNGTYLIAGGAGGLGYVFAQHLAKNYAAHLILIGRSTINETIEKKLDQLCRLGGNGYYYSVDINSEISVNNIFQEIRENDIHLNGVMNCAGLIEDSYIINKTRESFDSVIAPKIMGTLNLDNASKQYPLDFFILFSSIASIMPNQGQCDYAAANSFLDEFAFYRNHLTEQDKRTGKTIAINWPLWKDGGIGVIKAEEDHLWDVFGMKALESDRGLSIFDEILAQEPELLPSQLIVIEGEQYKIEKHLSVSKNENFFEKDNVKNESTLKERIRKIISREGGGSREIRDVENLADYGIDSVGLSKIATSINDIFSLGVDPTLFFDLNTVAKISNYIWENYSALLRDNSVQNQKSLLFTPERALIDMDFSDSSHLIFQKTLSDEEFFMKDHVVEGLYNVPGACYIEMALQAGSLLADEKKVFRLSNNYWAKQLSTSGDPIRADLHLVKKDDFYEYEITHVEGREKVIHALGQVHTKLIEDIDNELVASIDIDAVKRRCAVIRESEEIYKFIHAEGLHVGPSFQPMVQINLSAREALSHLKLPEFISNTYEDYVLHPSMLTGVLQTALLNNKPEGMNNNQFIPIAIDEIVVFRKIPKECYVYTEIIDLTKKNNEIRKYNARIITTAGDVVVDIKGLSLRNLTHSNEPVEEQDSILAEKIDTVTESSGVTLEEVCELLKENLSDAIGMPPCDIDANVPLESYGINSVMIVDLNRRLEQVFGNLSKTLFFEYKNILELAEYFLTHHQHTLQRIMTDKRGTDYPDEKSAKTDNINESLQEDNSADIVDVDIFVTDDSYPESRVTDSMETNEESIAIVGMSGRYPAARNLSEFWENLKAGKDSISNIPASRFDRQTLQKLFPDQNLLPEEWGGFLDDIDKFDPLFFNISPREAAVIDPQERLFLEVAWESIEDAGYNHKNLKGESVGVFVGALWQPYITLGVEQTFKGNLQRPHGLLYSIANRVSFFFDWCGPSLAVDTACSASLTALHLACESLKRKESHSAIVGGVNISLSSSKYLWLSNNNFLSSDGKCRSFGRGGDGYVPGEGVGAVYIKRLKDAIRDGDHIYGLIKGTSINHGGKTNGYTVPNPVKQAELILSTLNKSGISPEDISYVEAHGTGTSLGDPIEITGLQKAFSNFTDKKEFCAIGSVKSNIGHLEAAAGIAGLTKLLLQMKHRTLVPSINSDVPNPNIDFLSTPFVVQKTLQSWSPFASKDNDGHKKEEPLRAMVSSFGAGGSNAHAIVEEYYDIASTNVSNTNRQGKDKHGTVSRLSSGKNIIIPLSAKNLERLKLCASNLLDYINVNEADILNVGDHYRDAAIFLEDIAYTLQIGREEMDERVVFLVNDISDLKEKLKRYVNRDNVATSSIIHGNIGSDRKLFAVFSLDNELNNIFTHWISSGDGVKVATLWVNGITIDWNHLYSSRKPEKVSLPTYPFRKDRHWITETDVQLIADIAVSRQIALIHPLLHENTSDLYTQRYSSTFTGKEKYFEYMPGKETGILSRMTYLEMASAAIALASGEKNRKQNTIVLSDVEWINNFTVGGQDRELHIALTLDDDHAEGSETAFFEIYSINDDQEENLFFHARGCACIDSKNNSEQIDVSLLARKMNSKNLAPREFEPILNSVENLHYDGSIEAIDIGDNSALIKFESTRPSESGSLANPTTCFSLHPDTLRRVLPALLVIAYNRKKLPVNSVFLDDLSSISSGSPMMLKTLDLYQGFSENMYAWVKNISHSVLPASDVAMSNTATTKSIMNLDIDFIDNNGYVCARAIGLSFNSEDVLMGADILPSINNTPEKPPNVPEKPTTVILSELQSACRVKSLNNDLKKDNTREHKRHERALLSCDISQKSAVDMVNTSGSLSELSTPNHDFSNMLSESLANALYMELDDVDIDTQFTEMGLDSIVGFEWINELKGKFLFDINATIVYDYPTIREFSHYLESKMSQQRFDIGRSNQENVHGVVSQIRKHEGNKITDTEIIKSAMLENYSDSKGVSIFQTGELQKVLAKSLSEALYMDENDVNSESSFIDMGLDSIVGVEWIKAINDQFDTSISATAVYDYTNLYDFAHYLEKIIKNKTEEKLPQVEMAD